MAEVKKYHGNLPLIVFFTAFKQEYIQMLLANLVDKSVSLTVIHDHSTALGARQLANSQHKGVYYIQMDMMRGYNLKLT